MRAPITACFIVRDDLHISKAIESLRQHVSEVAVVYTGYDGHRADELENLADTFAVSTGCNNLRGEMVDFAAARNLSFALATEPWIMWADSDDLIVGAEHLDEVLGCAHGHERPRLIFPYDYATDPHTGAVTLQQYRERIVRNNGAYHWAKPVHEHLIAIDGRNDDYYPTQPIRWVHQRRDEDKGRNLRILADYAEEHDVEADAWYQLNYATELARAGKHQESIKYFEAYIAISQWDDERAMAMLRLSDVHLALDVSFQRGDAAMWWARQAHDLKPDAFEPLYQLARIYTTFGELKGDKSALQDAIRFARMAADKPQPRTPLGVNPNDRDYRVHDLIRTNAESLADWQTAVEACDAALAKHPNDGPMLLSRRRYANALKIDRIEPVSGNVDVLIVCGDSYEPWNPIIAERDGIGGSETAVMEIGKRLAAKGHRVRVFCNCGTAGLYDGVEYTNDLSGVTEAQVLVAWRDASHLEGIPAQVKLIWAHDVGISKASRWTVHLADRVIAVSNWHRDELLRRHGESCGLKEGKIVVLRNGIDPSRFGECKRCGGSGRNYVDPVKQHEACPACKPRRRHKAIYSSSPDRGLEQLLHVWPVIREQVPEAELHVFYGAKLLSKSAPAWAEAIAEQIRTTLGVVDRGKVNQQTLATEMLSAGVWLFPAWHGDRPWTETSCISAMEAQAAGLHIVTSPHAALSETVLNGAFVEGDARTPEYQARFAELAVERMQWTDNAIRQRVARDAVKAFGWDEVAEEWDGMLRELVGRAVAA